MRSRIVHAQSSLFIRSIILGIVLFLMMLGGCASPPPGPGPGKPDEMQWQHSQMLKTAIEEENKVNALVALDLFEQDVSRWYTNKVTEATAITELKELTDAVDQEDWDSAKKILMDLESKYRSEGD